MWGGNPEKDALYLPITPTRNDGSAIYKLTVRDIPVDGLLAKGKLTIPVLAIGGDHSWGARLATEIGFAATNVRGAVISDSGHWIMEEQPEQAIALILSFVDSR